MKPQQARQAVAETFPQPFDKGRFLEFSPNLLNKFDGSNAKGSSCLCVFLRLPRPSFGPGLDRREKNSA
jgi:hypothetical protein